jgi:GDP-4-dehydro-6-deoxy-D-mannose reductase
MERILVTGINGFAGRHLAGELFEADHIVVGAGRGPEVDPTIGRFVSEYYSGDLTQQSDVNALPLGDVDVVINLAGVAVTHGGVATAELYTRVNVSAVQMLAEGILKQKEDRQPRLLAISSGAVYDSTKEPPFNESSDLVPVGERSDYVESKIRMEKVLRTYREQGLNYVIARPFNHVGPGQSPHFLVRDLADSLLAAQVNGSNTVSVGDLTKERDFTDVRDMVRAYRLLAEASKVALDQEVYNICSGQAVSAEKILSMLVQEFGAIDFTPVLDDSRLNPFDAQTLFGSYMSLHDETGWFPTIPLKETIHDFAQWYKRTVQPKPPQPIRTLALNRD